MALTGYYSRPQRESEVRANIASPRSVARGLRAAADREAGALLDIGGGESLYSDIAGGGSVDVVAGDISVSDSNAQSKVYKFAKNLVQSVKDFRKNYDTDWDYYFNLLVGRQWTQPSSTTIRAPRMQNWRARLNINYTYAIMDTIVATVFDSDPKLSLQATSSEQQGYLDQMQAAVDQVWYDQKASDKSQDAFMNALTYGVGYLKVIWNPSAERGLGAIEIMVVPSENVYVDKNATSFDDAEAVVEIKTVPLSQLRRQFPNKARMLRPDAHMGSYGERKTGAGFGGNWASRPVELFSPADDQPRIADKTVFSAPPWRSVSSRGDYMCEVAEVWVNDYSKKEVEVQYVVGRDLYDRPVYAAKKVMVDAYPYGRLITIGGGTVLQDVPSPYRRKPYVVIKDIPRTGEFYARGEPEILVDLQIELNKQRSQMRDNAALMGNAVYIADKDAGIPPHMLMAVPGQIILKNPGKEIRREAPPEMPQWMPRQADTSISDMFVVAGVSGAGSQAPRGIRSGAGMQEAVAYQTQRIRRKGKRVEMALTDLGQILISLIQDNYTTPRMVRILGKYNEASFVPFDRWHARGQWDIRVEAGSAMAQSKTARRQEAIQLFQLGVIDDLDLLDKLEWPSRHEVLRRKGRNFPPQVQQYPGWPGSSTYSTDKSGYALSVRSSDAQPPQPPGPPPGMPPMGPPGGGAPPGPPPSRPGPVSKPPPKPKRAAGLSPLMSLTPFGPLPGSSKR